MEYIYGNLNTTIARNLIYNIHLRLVQPGISSV